MLFPVRHHSPAAALQVARLIRARRPKVVLVEGPCDATPLIPLLLDSATTPPIAIYAYLTGEQVRASYYPFCAYSPELVALRVGREVGARLEFCDLAAAQMLAWHDEGSDGQTEHQPGPDAEPAEIGIESDAVIPTEAPRGYDAFTTALADQAGFDSFEELWEADFEQRATRYDPAGFADLLVDFGGKARALIHDRRADHDDLRERHMAARALAAQAEGLTPDDVVLVCGAAHAEAIRALLSTAATSRPGDDTFGPSTSAASLALIPYSNPRLSEQSGYGAGNRAPWYYQQVWELGGDYAAATRRGLVAVAGHLRAQGQQASLAECIDAYNLAITLAAMRGKLAPGVDELREAGVACFGQGQPARVADALRHVLVGETIGRVTAKVGRTPLQTEFYATAQRLGLAIVDAPRQVLVHMTAPHEAEQSVFLHRLAVADVPYAHELESGLGGRGRAARSGPLEQLARVREKWELRWSPATDAKLVERTAWGSTLADVCGRLLGEQIDKVARVDAGTAVLLKMALCELAEPFPAALERCEALAADSASFPPLARATYHLDGLLAYGSARKLPADRLADLAARLFARAVLHLPAAAVCGDEAAAELQETLIALHELVRRDSPVAADRDAFWQAVEGVVGLEQAHPTLRGLTLILLELHGRLASGELTDRLHYWLSAAADVTDSAKLVAGLFALHRATLVRNPALIGAVTDFLVDLELEQLVPLLPILRRVLGDLSRAERAYLSETLARLLGLEAADSRRALSVDPSTWALLQEADASVAATLSHWKEHYGIE